MLITILSFLAILVVLIFTHELGHFIAAKLRGVKVEEFGIGFPPRLFGIKRDETVYSLNALPFGGFVRLLGEEDPTSPRSLASKTIATRFLVLSAGSLMNVLLPIVLFSLSFMVPHNVVMQEVQVQEVALSSPAENAGIEPGDIILKVNDRPVKNIGDAGYFIRLNLGSETSILLQKANFTQEEISVTPRWNPPSSEGATGIAIAGANSTIVRESYPFWEAIPLGICYCVEALVLFRNEVVTWFVGQSSLQVAGPIGIAQITGEVARAGLSPLMELAAFISINLAIINMFPFPGLDGGRLAFVILEWFRRGKRISPKREALVHLIGFAILLLVIFALSYYDIIRIIQGESLLP